MSISYLPQEILTDIFTRLPIETLSNVILVNKSYLKLITSSDFARAHLKHLKKGKQTDLSGHRLICGTSSDDHLLEQVPYESLLSESSSINVVDLDFPKNGLLRPDVCVVDSCDGLVCIVLRMKHVFLWNPCTGKYKKLPRLDLRLDYKERFVAVTYGFGYDESTDDYKVVAVSWLSGKPFTEDHDHNHYEAYVFSLRRNSWKKILNNFRGWVSNNDMGKRVNGKVHWFTSHGFRNGCRRYMISFDVVNEVFGRVELPRFKNGDIHPTLDVLEGNLCLLLNYEHHSLQKHVDLWVMKEYGVKESWTKIATFSCAKILNGWSFTGSVLPNGEILFHCSESLAVHNPIDSSFRLFHCAEDWGDSFQPVMYVQSLVSPVV